MAEINSSVVEVTVFPDRARVTGADHRKQVVFDVIPEVEGEPLDPARRRDRQRAEQRIVDLGRRGHPVGSVRSGR